MDETKTKLVDTEIDELFKNFATFLKKKIRRTAVQFSFAQ